MPRAFVIRPFNLKKDSGGTEIDFERTHRELIEPALRAAALDGSTTGEIIDAGNIREDMFALILEADLVVCDVTVHNANVFYELGIRHALRKKSTVMIKGTPTKDTTPFDLLTDRYLPYDIADPGKSKAALIAAINASLVTDRDTDSPIFQMVPGLQEADVAKSQIVPPAFMEEVERAQAAKSKGWLRLLADEVRDRRFWRIGSKLIGAAQWGLKDYDAATETWERIRNAYPGDIEANLALANIYERGFRSKRSPELLERSDQAIQRVLDDRGADRTQRAEALALCGRNQKTEWRLQFEKLSAVPERRAAAMSRELMSSYESYRKAFISDLNNFWAGIAAVQMGAILLDLCNEPFWADAFDEDTAATTYKGQLQSEVPRLTATVRVSVDAQIGRLAEGTPERIWAEISRVDVLFLDPQARDKRILDAYASALPNDRPFYWDAARGQLELFASLGFRAELVATIIDTIGPRIAAGEPPAPVKPVHLVMFAGHQIDLADRPKPRFPAAKEAQARAMLREALSKVVSNDVQLVGLGCAAPGADILAHELCAELGIDSLVCLPMPTDEYARQAFGSLDDWRGRFLDVIERRKNAVLELSERDGLPRWLEGSGANPWERGNRWVLELARSWGAARMTLIALWDQANEGDAKGGTAHMVQLARDAGNIRVEIVDCNRLAN